MNIDTDFKMDDLTLIKYLKSVDSPFLPKIQEVYEKVKDILNSRVQHVFPHYTLHNTGHSFRIMEYMSKLVSDLSKLNELEIVLMVYSALLHDIGMAVSEDDINSIKADSFPFCEVKFSSMKKIMGGNEVLALQEYVRRIHASLSGKYIRENLKDKLVIPKLTTLDFTKELALICEAHTEDYDWIQANLRTNEVRGDYSFNGQFIAAILRLADILDIDGNRTPYNLYKLISPKGISDEEWKQHFVISNNEKIVINEKTQQKKIVFHGKATSASIHRKILVYIGWVKNELTNSTALVNGMPAQYSLVYDTNPEVNIQTEGYTFSDYKMTLEFRAISSLLMGEKIYGSKSLGLRELIQNSLDSCRIRQETEEQKKEFGQDAYQPKIKVILDQDRDLAIIKDNGTGMSMDIIKKHFLNIGVSYYNSTDFLLKDFDYKPIGNFGIGFLSCFMLSDEVKVLTRHYKSKHKYLIELEKGNEWTSLTESEDVVFDGTEVILNYANFISVFDNKPQSVKDFLNTYFLTDGIDFELIDKSAKQIGKINNPIILSTPLDKGLVKIELQDYLKDIEGYALIKNKSNFIKKFDDLVFVGELYKYDDEDGLLPVKDFTCLEIDNYVNGNEIKYLTIPLVESHLEDDFLNGMKFTGDDVREVLEKLDRELTWISVIVPKDYQVSLSSEELDSRDYIFDKLTFEELEALGHSSSCKTKTSVETITLFEGRKNYLYLPFDKTERDGGLYWWKTPEKRKELFMRSVLIKDFRFNIPILASIFEINTIVANINSRKFIPDISRNNVDSKEKDLINYIIGKAIHIGASRVLTLEADEKVTLENFITTFYEQKTDYEK
ncbi:Histidine kinase-, DNA gyrase B-, and HSP90-like ATPase [Chitinophaga eiseniae]|uniref:Histidine kinase-, DNA gyrase B-, and HSP90-like ATPase n=1 Tax=Chitinophaga eiseniae TaxID=634771 RepID=A0A1T4SY71_9BACT|nr:HD domain-containing protein [Chitinophaga eiseniae]SKA33210.1 Histidine kinase-, DNA gyrase B-, and HSP90-like ATPase [Chitinophaga eiseniae]